jgi:endonuclease-3 related protein
MKEIYSALFAKYGPQGWWPLMDHKGTNPTKTGSIQGYHPGEYDFPKDKNQAFEICIGAILAQNTAWPNVEKALQNLKRTNALQPKGLLKLSDGKLKESIKPAGYYNQKARTLREFARFFANLATRAPAREELLEIWGIGKETADSMLLYAFKAPTFVVDAYTRRIFSHLGYFKENADYDEIKAFFEKQLKPDVALYQEFHALLVEHAKRYYSTKPYGEGCWLKKQVRQNIHT